MCTCDPLRFVLSQILVNFVQFLLSRDHLGSYTSETTETCSLCNVVRQSRNDVENLESSKPPPPLFSPEAIARIDRCIKLYKVVNITQRTTWISGVPSLSLAFTPEYFKLFSHIWSDAEERCEGTILDAFERSMRWLFHAHCTYGSRAYPLILMEKDQFMNQQIMLDRIQLTNQCILWTLKHVPNSILHADFRNESISIGMTELPGDLATNPTKLTMTQYRKILIGSYINQVCRRIGYEIDNSSFHKLPTNNAKYVSTVFVVNHASSIEACVRNIIVLRVGDVVTGDLPGNASNFTKRETIESFYTRCLRLSEQKTMDNPENSDCVSPEKLSISTAALMQAAIKFDLLNSSVVTQLELEPSLESSTREHDSFIVLYNYSRLISILKKFNEKVSQNEYPQILQIEWVDFSRLEHETEIALVQMLLDWPRVLENTVDFHRQEVNIGTHLKFMKEFAYRFNAFYAKISVLAQPSALHEFKLMFTRIYFLRAIRNVFHDFFRLMLIEFEDHESKL